MRNGDFNHHCSLNTAKTDKNTLRRLMHVKNSDTLRAILVLQVQSTRHLCETTLLDCRETILHFIYAQTVALDTVNC